MLKQSIVLTMESPHKAERMIAEVETPEEADVIVAGLKARCDTNALPGFKLVFRTYVKDLKPMYEDTYVTPANGNDNA